MKFEIYKDENGDWRWRLVARNGRIIAVSGEGYKRRGHAEDMVHKIRSLALETEIRIVGE